MAQITNLDSNINRGDYALLIFHANGVDYPAVACNPVEAQSCYWSFLIKGCLVDGSRRVLDAVENIHPYDYFNYGWIVEDERTLRNGLEGILYERDCTYTIITNPMTIEEFVAYHNNLYDSTIEVAEVANVSEYISDNYETTRMYHGFHCYHHGCELNKPKHPFRGHRIGVELEVEFESDNARNDFTEKESNWFYCESDGSLGSYGCEIITIPLLPKDAKDVQFWEKLTSTIQNKASSWDTGRCGLHVHIGREILGRNEEQKSETIGKLLFLYHHHLKDTRLNIGIYGRDRAYNDHDGKTDVGDAVKILGSEVLKNKDIQNRVKDSVTSKSRETRYFDINLQNTNTIEFRKGKGSINPDRISIVVEYSERMCLYAKITPWMQISYEDFVKYLKATVSDKLLERVNRLA